jgi:hypothetical protein
MGTEERFVKDKFHSLLLAASHFLTKINYVLSKLCNISSQLAANFATDKMSSSIQAKILEAKDVSKKGAIPKESENNGNEPTATPNTPTQNMEDKKSKGISK